MTGTERAGDFWSQSLLLILEYPFFWSVLMNLLVTNFNCFVGPCKPAYCAQWGSQQGEGPLLLALVTRVEYFFLWPQDIAFSKFRPCMPYFKISRQKRLLLDFFGQKGSFIPFTLVQSRPKRQTQTYKATLCFTAFKAFSIEASIDKVVYFINLGLTKFTSASGRRPCVRSVYSGLLVTGDR